MSAVSTAKRSTYRQYIDGEWVEAVSGDSYEVINPSTEEPVATVPSGSVEDARKAILAARHSFEEGDWANKPQLERGQILLEVAKHLMEASDGWAEIESMQAGATIRKTSIVDVPLAIEQFRHMAEQSLHIDMYEPLGWNDVPALSWNFVQREPIGVCSCIVPFNFPLLIAMWKLAPALAMGNSVVMKPSPYTPLSLLALVKAIDETGLLPKGVLNVVTGTSNELGEELVTNADVDKVSFTGSTATGRKIMEMAAKSIKKVTLELGGKSANIICEDADMEIAIDGALFANFFHQGQACESGTRVMVHEKIYDEFVSRLVEKAAALKVGDAMDHTSQVGPVISQKQYDNILASIKKAEAGGGRIRCGGGRAAGVGARGFYVAPTVITDVSDTAECTQEEIFGPVSVIQKWSDDDEVITRANNTRYGLAGGVWSKNIPRAVAIAKRLRTGTVWINDWHIINAGAPFGGYRESGIGRELGRYGLLEYTEIKHIHVDQGTPREERYFYDVLLGEDKE